MNDKKPCDWRAGAILAILAVASMARVDALAADATGTKTVTVRASDEYDRDGVWRMLFGNAWRDVWSAEITVPVLDLGSYAGGLKPIKAGGNQSRTLRFEGADGRTYVFRSTEKNVDKVLPPDLKDTPASAIAADQRATFHPTCHGTVTALQDVLGLLHTVPKLVYIPDDPRLGKFREKFANTLGQIEERPDENEKGPTFANAKKISGADKLMEDLEESLQNRVDAREYLAVRLLDFLAGDTDRGADQWRFAKFERDDYDLYRPIARDRDYAFMKVEGLAATLGRRVYPRLVCFDEKYPKMRSLLFMTQEFDRSHLIALDWEEWEKVVATMQLRLTDYVIERAVREMPEPHYELSGPILTAGLIARRDNLREIARDYYRLINQEADIFGSDKDELAEIERNPDGSVVVRLWRRDADTKMTSGTTVLRAGLGEETNHRGDAIFERRFVPDETKEIRVYLERGNDRAVVRGVCNRSIMVRVTGGEGDDVLEDSSVVEHGPHTRFYDASGENTFVEGEHTRIDTKPFVTKPPRRSLDEDENEEPEKNPRLVSEERRGRFRDLMPGSEDVIERQMHAGQRFWGATSGFMAMTGYRESGGVLLGVGPTATHFDFRHQPYAWRADARGILGTRNGEFGLQFDADRYIENSLWSVALFAHASELESNRFYGYGNDSKLIDEDFTLVERFEFLVKPALHYSINSTSQLAFGPVLKYVDADVPEGSPAADIAPLGTTESFGQLGAFADLDLDWTSADAKEQSGWGLTAGGSAYPSAWDAEDGFGEAHALARVFVPMGWPTLALRAGGQRAWGSFPLHESAFLGGRSTLRGFRWNRFAGDASAYASAELRVPLFRMTLLTRGQLGVIGFTDAGRVWMDGDSAGDWHMGYGGGLWFGTMGRQLSATYAHGDEHRIYFYTSMPF
ncbi:MAG TPA: BamA/TamA family outer membrane protein [Candidatus Krumholzibacteria bacterium]|nr:BamA/TamA family outer membrane protein [Candidatus Krumholzibacteria bacterium]